MQNVKYILKRFGTRYKVSFSLAFILIFGVSFINMAHQYIFGYLVDEIYYDKNFTNFFHILFWYALIFTLGQLMHWGINYIWLKLQTGFLQDIRNAEFSSIIKAEYASCKKFDVGDLTKRINRDSDEIVTLIFHNFFYTLANLLKLVIGLCFIASVSWKVALTCAVIIPSMTIVNNKMKICAEIENKKFHIKGSELNRIIMEFVYNIIEVRIQQVRGYFYENILEKSKEENIPRSKLDYINAKRDILTDIFLQMTNILLYALSYYLIIAEKSTIGEMIAIISYFTTCKSLFRGLYERRHKLAQNLVAVNRVCEILNMKEEKISYGNFELFKISNIVVKELDFSYGDSSVIRDLEFAVNQGEVALIKGDNGTGKTTLVKLLIGLYKPERGGIYIDNKSLDTYSLVDIRNKISIVWQENFILGDTIRNNMLFAKISATDEEIYQSFQRVGLLDIICAFPKKLDTIMGDEGVKLSGGQQQRLMIARIILRDPEMMIFDEATSSLDSKGENSIIYDIILKYIDKKTVFWISHYTTIPYFKKQIFLKYNMERQNVNKSNIKTS